MKNKTLNQFKENVFSQYGEDGIVKEILKRLKISSGTCVEFGAWDGVLLSNTALLWIKGGWRGVLIEAGKEKFETLEKIAEGYNCTPLNDFVTPVGPSSLESILKRENVSLGDVKVLSVDIDGNEYHILKEMSALRPVLIIAEYNPTIPPEMYVVSKEDAFFGSSAKALTELMEEKEYILVAMTTSNCFFVDKKFANFFSDLDTSFENLFDRTCLTYLITGYKGAYAFSQSPAYGMGVSLDKNLIEKGELFFMNHFSLRTRWNHLKDAIKRVGKKIIGAKNIEKAKLWKGYLLWRLKGMPVPAHGMFKWKIIREKAKEYNIETFLETGTAGGGTVLSLGKYFKRLYTIELDPTLYHQGRVNAKQNNNIICVEGDSGVVLKDILKKISEPTLFWLDAHFSGYGTARGVLDTPIVQELTSIFEHKNKNHVIVIDDMREFNGNNDYPEIEDLKKIISNKAPWYSVSHINDLLVIEPAVKVSK